MGERINSKVLVSVKANCWLRGILRTFDQHLNLIMDNVEELSANSATAESKVLKVGKRVLVRGDNVVVISAAAVKREVK